MISAFLSVLGCNADHDLENEDVSKVSIKNGRLVFENDEAFHETIAHLDKMDERELEAWEARLKIESYQERFKTLGRNNEAGELSAADEEFFKFPVSYRTVINVNGEVQVGDSILWYDNGNIYSVPSNDEALLQRIKENPSLATPKGKYSIARLSEGVLGDSEVKSGQRVGIDMLGGLDARHQYEFYQYGDTGSKRKYVHELFSYTQVTWYPDGYSYNSNLYLRIKLEWRGRSSWKPAGETRNIKYSLDSSAVLCNMHVPPVTSQSQCGFLYTNSYITGDFVRSSDLDVLMGTASSYQYTNTGGGNPYWSVEVSGSIYQHVQGDWPSNAWSNYGYPLW
ncbi:MAG: hypothetical protein ACJ8AT_30275 [Hyalangium sp.]|uniref:hypothetical protein n=1 Tax=Hyalangium sp. TaxID=2028555 RepID=UPI00389B07F5